MDRTALGLYFSFFNEIGIIAQLSRAMMDEALPDGLASPHFTVLNHLVRVGDGQTPLAMAHAFQTPKPTLTHTLAGLEKRGLVEMRPNPEDGRSKQVWITAEGRRFRDETIRRLGAGMDAFAAAFPAAEIADLAPRLAEIRRFLDAARD